MKFCAIIHMSPRDDSIVGPSKHYVLPPEADRYCAVMKALAKLNREIVNLYLFTVNDCSVTMITARYEYTVTVAEAMEDENDHFLTQW